VFEKLLVPLNAAVFILVVPYLEIGQTHVFNPDWPAHARLHEVWQLLTNAGIALLSLWALWRAERPVLAGGLALLVSGPFMAAYLLRHQYGGSMQHSDGSELLLLGLNPAVYLLAGISVALTAGMILRLSRRH
jgi:hypothetical protein